MKNYPSLASPNHSKYRIPGCLGKEDTQHSLSVQSREAYHYMKLHSFNKRPSSLETLRVKNSTVEFRMIKYGTSLDNRSA